MSQSPAEPVPVVPDVLEHGRSPEGQEIHSDRRIYMQLQTFTACKNLPPVIDFIRDSGWDAVIYQDASKRKHFESLATQDELTQLYNRRHFNEFAPSFLSLARAEGKIPAMFLLDVDFFKKYNDTYGHPAGDDVLLSIGKVLKENMQRNNDACFRLGGEEFAVLSLLSDYSEALIIAEKILLSISNLHIPHQHNSPGVVTVSIGAALSSKNSEQDIDAIYSQADKNLYTAKESGRNKYILS